MAICGIIASANMPDTAAVGQLVVDLRSAEAGARATGERPSAPTAY
jgi:hypothetical protein